MEFKIIAPGGNEIQLIQTIPKPANIITNIFKDPIIAKAKFGEIIFRNYKGDGFQIWFSNYFIQEETEMIGRADIAVLELHIQFRNRFNIEWDGVGKSELTPYQYNLSFTPFVNNWAKFQAGKECHTFDVHFTKEYLQRLSEGYRELSQLLELVEKLSPGQLALNDQFLTPEMIMVINQVLNCSFNEVASKFYVESKVMELLILALDHVADRVIAAPIKLSPYDIERLNEAKDIILADFENKISLLQLARKVGLNDFKLKKGFKHLFGTSVFNYQMLAKMEQAKIMLQETDTPIQDIGYMVGFEYVANFNSTFKRHFGYTPGYLRKK